LKKSTFWGFGRLAVGLGFEIQKNFLGRKISLEEETNIYFLVQLTRKVKQ
jgi:hypothetical protein